MPVFTVTGDVDPFLHVSMRKGETIYCESDAMVMMESTLDLKGKMKGGLGSALMRTFANGESFFQQHIEAARGDGDCLLSPTLRALRSKLLAHRCRSARASISWAVILTLSPERRTEPSTIASTSSTFAISGVGGRLAPLNCIAEPREITRSRLIVASCVVSSSVIPSAK